MNNLENKKSSRATAQRILPFFVEFVRFSVGFALIMMVALLALSATGIGAQ